MKAKAKITTGKWKQYAPIIGGVTDANYRRIEHKIIGYFNKYDNCGFSITGYINEADAKLMAAAPELLDALKSILPHLGNYADLHVNIQKIYIKAEKAIQRATL